MGDLYDTDVLAWSEQQAALLRQLAESRPSNEALDWANIIEEIESVGSSQVSRVKSLLIQALLHDLKSAAWPQAPYAEHWQAEARLFRGQAQEDFTASMRQKIDVARLYALALRGLPKRIDGQPPLPVPAACPVTLDELLGDGG